MCKDINFGSLMEDLWDIVLFANQEKLNEMKDLWPLV